MAVRFPWMRGPRGLECLRMASRALLLVPVVVLFCGHVAGASAHAMLMRSDPPAGTVLQNAPVRIHLWFTEDVNSAASQIIVWDRYRHVQTVGRARAVPGHPDELEVRLEPRLARGAYVVVWTSVSAQDGHVLHGYYSFGVKAMGSAASMRSMVAAGNVNGSFSPVSLAAILAHWIELLAVVTWVGAAAFSALLFSEAARHLRSDVVHAERERLLALLQRSLTVLALASAVVLLVQVYAMSNNSWTRVLAASSWSHTFASQYGELWLARMLLLDFTALATLALAATPRPVISPALGAMSNTRTPFWRQPMAMPMALGCAYLYLMAASGHAASVHLGELARSHIVSLSVLVDWLHYVGVALWFGGQIYIMLVLIPTLRIGHSTPHALRVFLNTLNRFSPVAYVSVAIFSISGAFVGKVHIASVNALVASVYGRALMVKLVLIGLMMLTSAASVYILRPALHRRLWPRPDEDRVPAMARTLARELRINPFLGAGVLLATSVMFFNPITPGLAQAGMPSRMRSATHQTLPVERVRTTALDATLSLASTRSGLNQLTVWLRDGRGHPIREANLIAQTSLPATNMGSALAPLHQTRPGVFRGRVDLSLAGRWRIELLIYRPGGLSSLVASLEVGR